jgi:hypothetical protein
MRISASIVVYKENEETLQKVLNSLLAITNLNELVVVDNSPTSCLKEIVYTTSKEILYIHRADNIGFGRGHNLAFYSKKNDSDIHLVCNPDIYFTSKEISSMIEWMFYDTSIALSVPRVYFPNGDIQQTIRKIPTIMTLFKRKFNIFGFFNSFIEEDEFQNIQMSSIQEIPFAHGCFFLFRSEIYKKLNGFDEDFFMYMEDVDIFIRAKKYGKTVVNPNFKIYHEFRKGSSKSFKLLAYHISSAVKFFLKHPST